MRYMRKEIKKCIQYYLKNINSDEYKEEKCKREEERKKVHLQYVAEMKPEWINRTDYYEDFIIAGITLYDVLSNDGVGKLLRKLYSLPKNKFKVKNYYKKPTLINKFDYVHLQYSGSGHGIFAEIDLLDDKYIRHISVTWTQINNYYAFFEYNFQFKQCLDDELYEKFIFDNIKKITSKDYAIWYYIINRMGKDELDCLMLEQMQQEYFSLIFQHYITSFFFSEQGKENRLVNMVYMTREKHINIDELYLGDLSISFYNQEANYVITGDFDGENYCLYAGNNRIPSFSILGYIARYGNEFYYRFLGNRELKIFEREFSKFSTGRKKITYNRDLLKLLNKMQSVSETESRREESFYEEFDKKWMFYISNNQTELSEFHKESILEYKKIYADNFSYLNLLSEINYTKSNHRNTIIATIVSILATVISLIALLPTL